MLSVHRSLCAIDAAGRFARAIVGFYTGICGTLTALNLTV